jgi:hypothetical protein
MVTSIKGDFAAAGTCWSHATSHHQLRGNVSSKLHLYDYKICMIMLCYVMLNTKSDLIQYFLVRTCLGFPLAKTSTAPVHRKIDAKDNDGQF